MLEAIARQADKYRLIVSRVAVIAIIVLMLFSWHSWPINSPLDIFLDVAGFLLIVVSNTGRLWASIYICGYKTKSLVRQGPYSIVRNPLYFFSFIGMIGLVFVAKNVVVGIIAILLYFAFYPLTVMAEEKKLEGIHGDAFKDFTRDVPRFIPKLSGLEEPEFYTIKIKSFKKALYDSVAYFVIYIVIIMVEKLHALGVLPNLIRLP